MTKEFVGAGAVRRIDAAKEFAVAPVYLAGEDRSGAARVVYPLRDDFGWSVGSTGVANVVLDSPCRRARIGYMPTHPLYDSLWTIKVAAAPLHTSRWTASFSHGTPSEIVAAFAEAMTLDLAGGSREALLGGHDLELVVAPLIQAGWQETHMHDEADEDTESDVSDEVGLGYISPDGLATVRWVGSAAAQEAEQDVACQEAWEVGAGLPEAGWQASFTAEIPDRLVAAVTRQIAASRPVFRDQREIVPELREQLSVSPARIDDGPATRQERPTVQRDQPRRLPSDRSRRGRKGRPGA